MDLYHRYAHRYDLHTPPHHYQHDHQLVLDLAAELGPPCRLLDVGCGTGVLLEKARAAGIDAHGLDSSPQMIGVARTRVPPGALRVLRMQDLDDHQLYDMIVSLSWSIHYCANRDEMRDVLERFHRALKPGGILLLQVAHAANATRRPLEDVEPGPTGIPGDVSFKVSFRTRDQAPGQLEVSYSFECQSTGESFAERHTLQVADARGVQVLAEKVGFYSIEVWDTWRRDPFARSVIPFVRARRT